MALSLPRLQRVVALVDRAGNPSLAFHRWWQSVAEAIENQVTDLLDLISRITTTETDVSALDGRVGAAETAIATVQTEITSLEAQDVTLTTALAAESGSRVAAIAALDSRIDSLEAFEAATPALAGGTWTPTLSGAGNINSATAYSGQYLRVGNVVHCSVQMDITNFIAGQAKLGVTLPIASNIGAQADLSGTANPLMTTSGAEPGVVYADAANDRAELAFMALGTTPTTWMLTFTYRII